MKPFRAQRGAKFFDFRFTFPTKFKHFRAQRGAKIFDFSSIKAKNNFELTFHYSFIAHHAPGIINNFFHNGLPAGRINYYNERVQPVQYIASPTLPKPPPRPVTSVEKDDHKFTERHEYCVANAPKTATTTAHQRQNR